MPVAHLTPAGTPCSFGGKANAHCLHCGSYVSTVRSPSADVGSGETAADSNPDEPAIDTKLGPQPSHDQLDALRAGVAKAPTWMILAVLAERGAEIGEMSLGSVRGCIVLLGEGAARRPGESLAPDDEDDRPSAN